jgi:hypothetical protein
MTEEEGKAFFEQVKGKPIKLSLWSDDGYYFVPDTYNKYANGGIRMIGASYINSESFNNWWSVYNGFEPDDEGDYWFIDYKLLANLEIAKALEE